MCLILMGALCLVNAAPAPATVQLQDLVDTANFLYDSLSHAQAQQLGTLYLLIT